MNATSLACFVVWFFRIARSGWLHFSHPILVRQGSPAKFSAKSDILADQFEDFETNLINFLQQSLLIEQTLYLAGISFALSLNALTKTHLITIAIVIAFP